MSGRRWRRRTPVTVAPPTMSGTQRAWKTARQRASDIASRSVDVTGTLSEFHRERFMQAAQDARARAEAEHERQVIAAQDARARAEVALELRKIWSLHSAGAGSPR